MDHTRFPDRVGGTTIRVYKEIPARFQHDEFYDVEVSDFNVPRRPGSYTDRTVTTGLVYECSNTPQFARLIRKP
jgi:hypothetical protein